MTATLPSVIVRSPTARHDSILGHERWCMEVAAATQLVKQGLVLLVGAAAVRRCGDPSRGKRRLLPVLWIRPLFSVALPFHVMALLAKLPHT